MKLFLGRIVGTDDPVSPEEYMEANHIGKILCQCWGKINEVYDNVSTDAFCLMPNHIPVSYTHLRYALFHSLLIPLRLYLYLVCFSYPIKAQS